MSAPLQTLIPPPAQGRGRPLGRTGRWLGFGLTARTLALLAAGVLLALPGFWRPRLVWFMAGWDLLVLLVALFDAWRLPRPRQWTVERQFRGAAQIGLPTVVELTARCDADQSLRLRLTDDLNPLLDPRPESLTAEVLGRDAVTVPLALWPARRGVFALGLVYLRWRGALGLAERWGAAALTVAPGQEESTPQPQRVRVYPAHEQTRGEGDFFLMRARQMQRQRRQQRLRGGGREFESLRDYQPGDELRSISWTATARRGRVVTRQFMAERSQAVWAVLDAGRLSRTALELRRGDAPVHAGETAAERDEAHRLTVTQLDGATTAATMLAQIVTQSGDKCGMLSYGTEIQQVLAPGIGPAHMRLLLEQLSATQSSGAESDPVLAVARLKQLQRRRGLFVWITELPDSAGRPALVAAAAELARRHLVVLVLLRHPELTALAETDPADRATMYHAAGALELTERRRALLAQLEQSGVLIVEAAPGEMGVRAVSEYLDIKARGLL